MNLRKEIRETIRESESGDYARDQTLMAKPSEYIILWAGVNRGFIDRVAPGWKIAADQDYNRYPVIIYKRFKAESDERALSLGKSYMISPYSLMSFRYGENYTKGGHYMIHNITSDKVIFNDSNVAPEYMFDSVDCSNDGLVYMGVKIGKRR